MIKNKMTENCEIIQEDSQNYIGNVTGTVSSTFQCRLCKKPFQSRDLYEAHFMKIHSNPYACESCGRAYKNRKSLLDHMALYHNPASKRARAHKVPVTCTICNKTFKHRNSLASHTSLYHKSDPGTLECKHCGKVYSSQRNLQIHIEAVHEKKTYKCTECDKTYSQSTTMYHHRKKVHGSTYGQAMQTDEDPDSW
jgi:DNA-directed RNA polymerase subunit M/transcription elongation factor TFIIS